MLYILRLYVVICLKLHSHSQVIYKELTSTPREVHVSILGFRPSLGLLSVVEADGLGRALAPLSLVGDAEHALPLPISVPVSSQLSAPASVDSTPPIEFGVATLLGPAEIMAALEHVFSDHVDDKKKVRELMKELSDVKLSALEDAKKISQLEAQLSQMTLERDCAVEAASASKEWDLE